MKRISGAIGLAVLLLAGSIFPPEAAANGMGHGGGSWHGGGTRVFISGGFGWWGWPGWWGPSYPYYAAPPVVAQQWPTEYIQQDPAPLSTPQYWYYCQHAGAYYPYVQTCPGGWMQVVPQPPPGR